MMGDDFSKVNTKAIARTLSKLQLPDGRYCSQSRKERKRERERQRVYDYHIAVSIKTLAPF